MQKVDILYLAWERFEFTLASVIALDYNTDWSRVNKLWIYTDSSRFPSLGRLQQVDHEIVRDKFGSPVAIMNDYLQRSHAEIFVKIDNDTMLPPGWLDEGLRLMGENPHVDLLGIEAHLRPPCDNCNQYQGFNGIRITDHIGGIGFMRRRAFEQEVIARVDYVDPAHPPEYIRRPQPMVPRGTHYGFTEFQWQNPQIIKAWIDPPLRVFLLDHLPFEPWRSLSEEYIRKGWQRRQWGCYGPEWSGLWEWWRKDNEKTDVYSGVRGGLGIPDSDVPD